MTLPAMSFGANPLHKFRHVTVPIVTPAIFFHLVTSVISALQFFAIPHHDRRHRLPQPTAPCSTPSTCTNRVSVFQMGLASALAWLLFVVTLIVTLVIFRTSRQVFIPAANKARLSRLSKGWDKGVFS